MIFRTHFVFALSFYLILLPFLQEIFSFTISFFLATFLVDLDSKNSKLGKFFIFRPFQLFFKHRGSFHSLFIGFIISMVVYPFNLHFSLGFLLGFSLHLLLDCLTIGGVRLFWPFFNLKISGFLKSGGLFEEILFVLLLILDFFLVAKSIMLLFNI